MLSPRSFAVVIILATIPVCLSAQPPVDSPPAFFVHHKQASSEQGLDQKYGSSVALTNGVLVAADENEHVEILRQAADGTWALEATIPAPEAGIAFGAREALATNGDWIAVGAKMDDTFGTNAGAVHMYKFNGLDWDYRGALSHMAPFGNIVTDQFGMALAMDGERMVVGSRAENGAGAAGAVHYFQYNGMLDMWIESGFIASEHTSGNSTSKFAESVDISGDYMIVGEHRNNTNGNFAGAAHIYSFYNQCWHLQNVFYGHNADDILGKDVAISGTVAIAGSPFADTDGLNEAGAVTVYELVPFSGGESAWAETAHFAPEGTAAGDWVGSALDIDGSLIAVGVPRDDAFPINGGAGYFLFDCSDGALTCVSEGYACDAMQNDRLGFDVAVSNGLAAIGATLDDNIYEDAGSVYILGADDVGFECDLTAPGVSGVDLLDVDDTGISNQDDITRHTTPDFDVFLPGGGPLSVMEGWLAEAGDALVWYMEGTGDSAIHILSQDDIDAGVVPITFIYPGPVLPDGEYTFCSYVIDAFGNIGDTGCLTIAIDNEDPLPSGAFDSPVLALADTTLYLDANGDAELLVYPLTNLTATDNIGIDTLFVDLEEYDCSNLNVPVTVTLTAIDLAGNIGTTEFTASVLDITGPVMTVQDLTVYLDESGNTSVSPGEGDAGSYDVCSAVEFSWEQAPECAGNIPRYPLTSGTYDDNTSECDDCTTGVEIGFDFNFYGEEYSSLWISSNGLLSFLSDDDYCCEGESLTDGSYEAVIAVIHTDIDPDECDDCGIYYSSYGEAPNREFVVSWHYVSNYEENEIRHDGQAVLYEGSNVIEIFNGGFSSYLPDDCDDPMTTGISNQDGTEGVGPYEQICDPVAPALFVFTPNTNGGYDMVQCTSDLYFNCSHVGENTVVLVATDESGNASQHELTITVLDEVGPSIAQEEYILYLNALGEVEDEDLTGIYTANDICGMDTSYVTHTLSCDDAIGIDDQVLLVEAGEDMMLFVDHDQNLYGFNASTNAVTRIEADLQGFSSADLMFSDGEGNIVFGEGDDEFIRINVQTGAASGEFYSDEDNGIMFDNGNGLGFEDLQSVETVGGVHYALSHDGDGYNVGSGTPLFSFELGSAYPETNYYAPFTATLIRMLPAESPEGNDWDWTALAVDAEQQVAYAICDENGLDSGSSEKELWSIDMSSSPVVEASNCPECDVDAFVEYTKEDSAIGVADTITPYVALARGNRQGYFNAITQNSWNGSGPEGTYWKMGPTAEEGAYSSWVVAHDNCASCQVDDTISLWIPQGNFFFDIVTTSWTCCQDGGGFSYSRTLVDAPEYAVEVPSMEGVEHLGRISSPADAMIFYDGSLILGFENGNIGRVSFSDSGLEQELLVANVASDDFGAVLSGFSPQYSSSIDVTAIDIYGNTSESQLSVLLVDTILPTILAQDTTLFLDGNGLASLTLEELAGGSYDNCGIESLTSDGLDFDCDSKGDNSITITAVDNLGNVDSLTVTVTVLDLVLPTAVAQDITIYLDAAGTASIDSSDVDNGSDHPCGGIVSMDLSQSEFDCSHVGANTVTLTVFDGSGNSATDDANVQVVDTISPSAIAQDLTVQLDASGAGSITAAQVGSGSSDACGIADLSLSQLAFDCTHVGTNAVTLTVTDNNGNQSVAQATITVLDEIDPVVLAQNVTVQLDANGAGSVTAAQIDNGSSDACGISSTLLEGNGGAFVESLSFNCSHVGSNEVTILVTDVSGNEGETMVTVTVEDNVNPTAMAQDLVVQLDASGAGSITAAQIDNGSSDACGIATTTLSQNSFDCSHVGANSVTLTVTDNNGNVSTDIATVTVEDNVDPVAIAQNITLQLDASGAGSIAASQIDNGSNDACGIATITVSQESFDCSHVGANEITLTVTDNNGNVSTDIATVTVEDKVDPVAIAQDLTVELDASGAGSITVAQIDNGSSDACGIATTTLSQNSFDCSHVGANSVTLTVTDNNGNVSTDIATVTVEDNVDPVAIAQNITLQLDASGAGSIAASQIDNGSNDACGIATITVSQESFDCSHVGANEITLTVTDNNGNVSTDIATVTVEDKVDPVAIAQDLTVELDASGAGSITAAQIDNGSSDACGIATTTLSQESFDCTHLGANTVTLTVTDNNGNETTASATITVEDNMAPTVSASGVTVYLDENGSGTLSVASTASGVTDNCSVASLTISIDGSAPAESVDFDCSRVGDGGTEAEILVTDGSGNSTSATAIIIALDTISPVVLTQNLTIQLDVNGAASITAEAVNNGSSDACGIENLALNQTDFDCSHVGTNTVTLAVTDVNGNLASATATVTVQDNVNPQAVAQDLTVQLDADGAGSITVDQVNNGSSDACGIATMTLSQENFDCSHVGTNTVTLTVTDNNGNVSTDIATVTVEDNVNPQAVAQDLTVQLDANGAGSITAEQVNDGSSDACGVASLALSQTDFDCSHVGANTVTLTVTDNNGNQNTTTATITVEDNVDPSISLGASDMTVECDGSGNQAQLQAWLTDNGGAEASDACGISWSHDFMALSDDCGNTGSALVIFTVQDPNGNSVTTSATFTIEDKTNPSIDVDASNETVECDGAGNGAQLNAWLNSQGGAVASDICGDVVWTNNHTALSDDCGATGSTTVMFTATDDCGLFSTTTATFTIEDTTQPDIDTDPQDVVYQRDGNEAQAFAAWLTNFGGMTSTDVCGGTTQSHNSLGLTDECGSTGTETVTFTSTDDCNNTDTRDATFTVIDEVAPSCPLIDLIDASDSGADMTDNITNDDTPTMRVMFTGIFAQSAESGDVVELYINSVLTESYTIDQTDVDNGYAEFETGSHSDGSVSFSARHIDGCDQASIFAFLNIIVHTTAPDAQAQDLTIALDENGQASIDADELDNGSSNDFGAVSFAATQTSFDCSDVGDNAVTLTVTDIAGNTATADATVTVEENLAPMAESNDLDVYLDANGMASIAASDVDVNSYDNCAIDSMWLDQYDFDCTHVGLNEVQLTVLDVNGNSASALSGVTVLDTVSPAVTLQDIVVELDENGAVSIVLDDVLVEATDACGIQSMVLDVDAFDCNTTGDNEVTVTATDVNGNATVKTANVVVEDNEMPEVNIFDLEDYTLYAGESCVNMVDLFAAGQPWYEATDNCTFDVDILYDEINEAGIEGCREFDRRWIIEAVDASGNVSRDTTLQHITVVDTTAPVVFLAGAPADVSLNLDADCNGDMPAAAAVTASATDNCTDAPVVGAVSYVDSAPAYLCGDAGSYTVLRTYMASATDNCGNAGMASATQTVTFLDVTAPQITSSNGISNGETVTQSQEGSIFSWIVLANPVSLVADDACGGEVTVVEAQSFGGLLPTEDIGNYCEGATPEAFMDGDACTGNTPAAMVLEGAYFDGAGFTVVEGGINLIESHYDNTLFIQVEMENADGSGGFVWSADYNAAYDWAQWSGLGRGYKKDCSNVMPGESPWTDWSYLVMQTGGMIGTGIYAGSELSLTHQPMNYYYGLQVGDGANNQNANYGASAWFYWSGQLIVNGTSQGFMGSSGDIMLDMDCALPWTAEYDYLVTDACGNLTEFGYTVAGDGNDVTAPAPAVGSGHTPFDISVGGDLKDPIRVTGLLPNPTNNVSQLGFVVANNMRLRVDLYSMSGGLIQELYDGNAMSDVEYLMTIDAEGLDAGMYQIRIASNAYMAVKKLLVTQ